MYLLSIGLSTANDSMSCVCGGGGRPWGQHFPAKPNKNCMKPYTDSLNANYFLNMHNKVLNGCFRKTWDAKSFSLEYLWQHLKRPEVNQC